MTNKLEEYKDLLLKKRQKGLEDLYFFNKYIIEEDEQRRNFVVPHVHGEWSTWFADSEKRIRCILVPRSSFKSSFFTVGWTLQLMAQSRANRVLIANATSGNAQKFLGEIKSHIRKNETFISLYGDMFNKELKWTDEEVDLVGKPLGVREPNIVTTGVGGNLVSQHYDYIICDDLVNLENSATRLQSNKVIDWWRRSLSLLEPTGTMIIVGTRWSYFELYSYLQKELSGEVDFMVRAAHNKDNSLYFPERFDEDKLAELKRLHGSYIYSAFYENNPIDPDTAMIGPSQLKYFTENVAEKDPGMAILPDNVAVFISVDPAVSEGRLSDYSGFIVVGVDVSDNWYILESRREKVSVGKMIDVIFDLNENYKPETIGLEVIGQAQALMTSIHSEEESRQVYLPIFEIKSQPMVRKEIRIRSALQPRFERGKIYLKKDQPELEDELIHFPLSEHDDLVDALCQIQDISYPATDKKVKKIETYSSKLVARIKDKDKDLVDEFLGEDF